MPGGIAFDETMEGWFALGAVTPEEGVAKGRHDGTRLAMHARVSIDDLDRFVAVAEHPGGLTGTIDFQPIGLGLPATSGVFQLFAPGVLSALPGKPTIGAPKPSPAEGVRRMVYELAFLDQGRPRYLAGEKRVRNEGGVDLWKDTTTLYTRLHDGADAEAPVIGAGILTLGVPQLLALMSTMRPINGGGMETVGRFGMFFFGELWEVYAPHLGRR